MTQEQFCYWLQGFVELNSGKGPTLEQWKSICEHIGTVFHKVTPPVERAKPVESKPADYTDILEEAKKRAWREVDGIHWPSFPLHPYDLSPKCGVGNQIAAKPIISC